MRDAVRGTLMADSFTEIEDVYVLAGSSISGERYVELLISADQEPRPGNEKIRLRLTSDSAKKLAVGIRGYC